MLVVRSIGGKRRAHRPLDQRRHVGWKTYRLPRATHGRIHSSPGSKPLGTECGTQKTPTRSDLGAPLLNAIFDITSTYLFIFCVSKRYHSDKHLSEFLPTRWRQKSTGIDEEKITPLSPYAQMKVVFGITLGYNALDRNLGISKSQGTTIRNHVQNSEFSLRFCF